MYLPRIEGYRRRVVKSGYRKASARLPRVVYLAILAGLIFVGFQCVRTILVEAYKLSVFAHNQPIVAKYYQETLQENRILRDKIKSSSSPQGIESLARNYLNLTGENEILVRMH